MAGHVPVFMIPLIIVLGLVWADTKGNGAWSLGHFTAYLATTVRRNLPLGPAVWNYGRDLPLRCFLKRGALNRMSDVVNNGLFLADAMDRNAWLFPPHYRALVRAGEDGGNLGRVLDRLAKSTDLDDRLGRRAVGYALYPAFLILVATGYSFKIVARFSVQAREMSMELEPDIMRVFWVPALFTLLLVAMLAIMTIGFAWPWLRSLVGGRKGTSGPVAWLAWRAPIISRYERRRAVAHYALVAGGLMEAGVPEVEALRLASQAAGSMPLERIALDVEARVAEGAKLSDAFRLADPRRTLPAELLWHVEVGEASGRLPEALVRASEVAFARCSSTLSRLVSAIFPLGILATGWLVWVLAYAVMGSFINLTVALAGS